MIRSTRRFARTLPVVLLGALIALAVAACGGAATGNESQGNSAGTFTGDTVAQRVAVSADASGAPRWDKATYEAQAGAVTFVVSNPSAMPHQFAVEGNGVNAKSDNLKAGTMNTFTLKDLQAGEYQIVCNYPGHKEAGMVASLVVK